MLNPAVHNPVCHAARNTTRPDSFRRPGAMLVALAGLAAMPLAAHAAPTYTTAQMAAKVYYPDNVPGNQSSDQMTVVSPPMYFGMAADAALTFERSGSAGSLQGRSTVVGTAHAELGLLRVTEKVDSYATNLQQSGFSGYAEANGEPGGYFQDTITVYNPAYALGTPLLGSYTSTLTINNTQRRGGVSADGVVALRLDGVSSASTAYQVESDITYRDKRTDTQFFSFINGQQIDMYATLRVDTGTSYVWYGPVLTVTDTEFSYTEASLTMSFADATAARGQDGAAGSGAVPTAGVLSVIGATGHVYPLTAAAVPEPRTALLMLAGLFGMASLSRRRSGAAAATAAATATATATAA